MFNPFFHPLRQALLNYSPMAGDSIPVDSIQHFDYHLSGDDFDLLIEIDEVDLRRSVVVLSGFYGYGAAAFRIFTSTTIDDSTHVLIHRCPPPGFCHSYGHGSVVQFSSGVVKSVQPVVFDMVITEFTVDVTIDEVDLNMSFVLYNGREVFENTSLDRVLCSHFLLDSTTVRSIRHSNLSRTVEHCTVVEFK